MNNWKTPVIFATCLVLLLISACGQAAPAYDTLYIWASFLLSSFPPVFHLFIVGCFTQLCQLFERYISVSFFNTNINSVPFRNSMHCVSFHSAWMRVGCVFLFSFDPGNRCGYGSTYSTRNVVLWPITKLVVTNQRALLRYFVHAVTVFCVLGVG